jgi:ABC-type polysaccharide/polyol phosphate transport system, ATPase component
VSDIAIKVENLSKCYQIYEKPHDRLLQMLARGRKQFYKEFWALKDVSFEVKKGETVGIIGRNGSGKSTLLQMICGTLNPTSGTIQTNGRIAALLELGSGFNPEFTGRENVYMNGAVLGLNKDEIDGRFAEIAAFAEIGDFIEQPVKTYSSGMMIRLAFAVAINVDPEILIVDEALSVGDELFQRKCFSRIEAIKKLGATILFVSHSGAQVIELCDHAVLMDEGEKLAVGQAKQIVGHYQKLLYAPADIRKQIREKISQDYFLEEFSNNLSADESLDLVNFDELKANFDVGLKPTSTITYESNGALIENVQILTLQGDQVNNLLRGETYRYTYVVKFYSNVTNVRFGMLIKTTSGIELGGAESVSFFENAIPYIQAGKSVRVEFRFNANLNTGVYFMNAGVLGSNGAEDGYLHRLVDGAMFRILPDKSSYATAIVDFGCVPEVYEIRA